jgi:predicted RNase H-like HicB family nuclease
MLSYPARIIPAEDGSVLVRFPDVPEAAAVGATEQEALINAGPVLAATLSLYREQRRSLPRPSDICGAPAVEVAGIDEEEADRAPPRGGGG